MNLKNIWFINDLELSSNNLILRLSNWVYNWVYIFQFVLVFSSSPRIALLGEILGTTMAVEWTPTDCAAMPVETSMDASSILSVSFPLPHKNEYNPIRIKIIPSKLQIIKVSNFH